MDNIRRPRPYLFAIICLFVFSSCKKKPAQVTRSYYFWRNDDGTSDTEENFIKQHGIRKLYTRLMDVDWSEIHGPVPVATVPVERLNFHLRTYDSLHLDIVPVVFITNKVFEKIEHADIPLLATRVVRRCLPAYDDADRQYEGRKSNSYSLLVRPKEIQFDCDWTVSTSKKYFSFLKKVKELLPSDSIHVSATIRLHQYKYPTKTGVPPVHRGMLMVYNISDPKAYTKENSIFEYEKAKAYFTSGKKYALPLDIALPAFSWCLIFRERRFYQIENGLTEEDLQQHAVFEHGGNGLYRVKRDTVFRELFLRPGDEIKAETIDALKLQQAAALAQKAVNTDQYSISLFELSDKEIKNYSSETIDKVYRSYH